MSLTPVPSISPQAALAWITSEAPLYILDVREPSEYAICHLPHAHLIPLAQLPAALDQLPKDEPILVYCHHGVRAEKATLLLCQHGYDAKNLIGGIDAYADQVDPRLAKY